MSHSEQFHVMTLLIRIYDYKIKFTFEAELQNLKCYSNFLGCTCVCKGLRIMFEALCCTFYIQPFFSPRLVLQLPSATLVWVAEEQTADPDSVRGGQGSCCGASPRERGWWSSPSCTTARSRWCLWRTVEQQDSVQPCSIRERVCVQKMKHTPHMCSVAASFCSCPSV